MNIQLILWGITGYIAFLFFQMLTRPYRYRSGWDFVVQTAIFALPCYFIAKLIILIIFTLFSIDAHSKFYTVLINNFGDYFIELSLGILIVAPLVGISTAYIWQKGTPLLSKLTQKISGKKRTFEFPELFMEYCHKLLGKLAIVTLKSNKGYVGILDAATEDPNETHRVIQLIPIASGYRKTANQQVVLNTNYRISENDKKLANRHLLIPFTEISTIAQFDPELHKRFVQTGITQII